MAFGVENAEVIWVQQKVKVEGVGPQVGVGEFVYV